jgi:hypothetical protein
VAGSTFITAPQQGQVTSKNWGVFAIKRMIPQTQRWRRQVGLTQLQRKDFE